MNESREKGREGHCDLKRNDFCVATRRRQCRKELLLNRKGSQAVGVLQCGVVCCGALQACCSGSLSRMCRLAIEATPCNITDLKNNS